MLMNNNKESNNLDKKSTSKTPAHIQNKTPVNSLAANFNVPSELPYYGYMPFVPHFNPFLPGIPGQPFGSSFSLDSAPTFDASLATPWPMPRTALYPPANLDSATKKPLPFPKPMFNPLDFGSLSMVPAQFKPAVESELIKSISVSDDNTLRPSSSLISLLTNISDLEYSTGEDKLEFNKKSDKEIDIKSSSSSDRKESSIEKLAASAGEESIKKLGVAELSTAAWERSQAKRPRIQSATADDSESSLGNNETNIDQQILTQLEANANFSGFWAPPAPMGPVPFPIYPTDLIPPPFLDCISYGNPYIPKSKMIPPNSFLKPAHPAIISVPKPKEIVTEKRKRPELESSETSLRKPLPPNALKMSSFLSSKTATRSTFDGQLHSEIEHGLSKLRDNSSSDAAEPISGTFEQSYGASDNKLQNNSSSLGTPESSCQQNSQIAKRRRAKKKRAPSKPFSPANDVTTPMLSRDMPNAAGAMMFPFTGSLFPGQASLNSNLIHVPYPMMLSPAHPVFPMPMPMQSMIPPRMMPNPFMASQPPFPYFPGKPKHGPGKLVLNERDKEVPSLLEIANSATASLSNDLTS